MSTRLIHSLRSSGGDYTLMSSWEDDIPADLTASSLKVFSHSGITGSLSHGDSVTGGTSGATGTIEMAVTTGQILITVLTGTFSSGEEIYETDGVNYVTSSNVGDSVECALECYNDWSSGLVEKTIIASRTTSSANGIIVISASGSGTQGENYHNGSPSSGFLYSWTGTATTIDIQCQYVTIEKIRVHSETTTINTTLNNVLIDRCINDVARTTNNNVRIGGNSSIRNSLMIKGSYGVFNSNGGTESILNCIATGSTTGFRSIGGASHINCIGFGCGTDFLDSSSSGTKSNNASSDTTAVGTSPITGIDSTEFDDSTNNDFHLDSSSQLIDAGTNLYSTFTEDIDGDTWPSSGAWDIGFDYYVAAGGITGSGSPTADTATSTGSGLRVITGSGSPQAETATSSGTGTAGSTHTGSGSPQADTATSAGSGLRIVIGSGSPTAEIATSSGVGLRVITGTGSPQADTATSTGSGASGNVHSGSGSPQAETATSSGAGLRLIIGSGSPQADTATSTGAGGATGETSGSGNPQADTATSSGVGLRIVTGSGSPQADTATCIGYDVAITISSCRVYNKPSEDRVYDMKTENRIYNKRVC